MIANWNDVQSDRLDAGHMQSTWRHLGDAAGSERVGVNRVEVEPNRWNGAYHAELDAEEIFYVLGGSGIAVMNDTACAINPGDCVVCKVADAHAFRAGDDGLDLLAFGERMNARYTHFPRTNVVGNYPGVILEAATRGTRDREVEAGEPEIPDVQQRTRYVVNAFEIEPAYDGPSGVWAPLARHAGATRTGLNYGHLNPSKAGAPPHCHSADEELFVILDGGGTLELWPPPQASGTAEIERHEIRAGDVVSRPAGTRISHHFIAGDDGMSFLAYGTREPNDICYYPRSNKIFWRGVGLMARLENLEYDDGEPVED